LKIRDSIIGDNTTSLAEFTFYTANKYRRGQFDEDMGFGFTIHNVLLVCHFVCLANNVPTNCRPQRHFALRNIELIKKPSALSGDNDGDDSDTAQPGSKRPRTLVGRIAKGEDFWGRVDKWFVEMVAQYGRVLTGARWKE
jgi:hypothetical protein